MTLSRRARLIGLAGVTAVIVGALAPAFAQPASQPTAPAGTLHADKNQWTEKYKDELRDHPRLGKALVDLHVAKEHLQKAPHDFGGHRADAVKACDEAIKQIELAVKFDAKHDDKTTTTPSTTTPPSSGSPPAKK